jgi:hypothetical protein
VFTDCIARGLGNDCPPILRKEWIEPLEASVREMDADDAELYSSSDSAVTNTTVSTKQNQPHS